MTIGFFVGSFACAPANPSASSLAGPWRADWTCGLERLELKPDGTYTYTIDLAAGGRFVDSGKWHVIPKVELLAGARVVLTNALVPCTASGEKIDDPERHDRELETIWEWGRMILSFHPDIEGFTRA